jgi:hypothetical protein
VGLIGNVDAVHNLLPRALAWHHWLDTGHYFIDPEVLQLVFCSDVVVSTSLSLQTRTISKGEFYNEDTDVELTARLGDEIDAPHVPTWVFRVYKTYIYDVMVQKKREVQHRKTTKCVCECGRSVNYSGMTKHLDSLVHKAWMVAQGEEKTPSS